MEWDNLRYWVIILRSGFSFMFEIEKLVNMGIFIVDCSYKNII